MRVLVEIDVVVILYCLIKGEDIKKMELDEEIFKRNKGTTGG